jgi:hypothetical protein
LGTASWESKLELLHCCVPKLELGNKKKTPLVPKVELGNKVEASIAFYRRFFSDVLSVRCLVSPAIFGPVPCPRREAAGGKIPLFPLPLIPSHKGRGNRIPLVRKLRPFPSFPSSGLGTAS